MGRSHSYGGLGGVVRLATGHVPAEGIWSSDGRYLYTVGLIDCLIPYYWRKRIEAASYEIVYCGSTTAASAVAPDTYAERQIDMMEKICLGKEPAPQDVVVGPSCCVCPCF